MPCKSGIIPSIDFTKWAEYGHDYAPHDYVSVQFNLIEGKGRFNANYIFLLECDQRNPEYSGKLQEKVKLLLLIKLEKEKSKWAEGANMIIF